MKPRRLAAVIVAVALTLAACGGGTDGHAYRAETLDGATPVSVADLAGRPALLTSWATWCRECKKLLPELELLYHARGDEVQVVAVNVNAGRDDTEIREVIDRYGMTMAQWRDPKNGFTGAFSAPGVPTTVLLDAEGNVLERWPGVTDLSTPEITEAIDAAVAGAPGK